MISRLGKLTWSIPSLDQTFIGNIETGKADLANIYIRPDLHRLIFWNLKTGKTDLVNNQNSIGCIDAQNCEHFCLEYCFFFLLLLIKSGENYSFEFLNFPDMYWHAMPLSVFNIKLIDFIHCNVRFMKTFINNTYFLGFGVYFQVVSLMGFGCSVFKNYVRNASDLCIGNYSHTELLLIVLSN